VTILAKARSLVVVLPLFVAAVATPVHAEHVEVRKITITVSAAASLNKVYTELGKQFEKANPSIKVRFNFASSSSLVSQIQSGAPSDVFAAADVTSFDRLLATGNVAKQPKVFARNSMQLVVKPGNPLRISIGRRFAEGLGHFAVCKDCTMRGVRSNGAVAVWRSDT
jgi:ABC-type molybdate transport system substrate-binding protein